MQHNLNGQWKATAFDGFLHETWRTLPNGQLEQEGFYIANGDTLYKAVTRLFTVNQELILLSVIKDSSPKVFKATSIAKDRIVFENTDYRNPSKVIYTIESPTNYQRSILGIEPNGDSAHYQFDFVKIK
ncbi:hypothetical protein [Marinoscillum furvescens]|uniref:hypothetical protein n=1 Tax=Marinoscillum furvescens TaxID=1026 RepID=UPI0011C03E58|nr:hypothetical protein [Marinoscillum furvescens]